MITLKSKPSKDIEEVVKLFLNQVVYVNWPHYTEAKVVQIFDATKLFDGSSDNSKRTVDSRDFCTIAENLNSS